MPASPPCTQFPPAPTSPLPSLPPHPQVRKSFSLKALLRMEAFLDSPGSQVGAQGEWARQQVAARAV